MQSYGKNLIKANKITKTKAKNVIFGRKGLGGRVMGGKTNAATNGCKYATKGENVK